jgi:TPR repeat protein
MMANARGVIGDDGRAVALYQRACKGGVPASCANLGVMLVQGRGIEADAHGATELFQRACKAGNAEGCYNLAFMYLKQGKRAPIDKPAEPNEPPAQSAPILIAHD